MAVFFFSSRKPETLCNSLFFLTPIYSQFMFHTLNIPRAHPFVSVVSALVWAISFHPCCYHALQKCLSSSNLRLSCIYTSYFCTVSFLKRCKPNHIIPELKILSLKVLGIDLLVWGSGSYGEIWDQPYFFISSYTPVLFLAWLPPQIFGLFLNFKNFCRMSQFWSFCIIPGSACTLYSKGKAHEIRHVIFVIKHI